MIYSGILTIFLRYWRSYGGVGALVRSGYLHGSILILIITAHYWLNEKWWEQPLSILPNLLGFSLGGLAMFLSFGDEKFRSILAEDGESGQPSAYMELCSAFVHFIVMQLGALMFALVMRSLDFTYEWPVPYNAIILISLRVFSGIGYLLFLYSVSSMLAATMAVFRICFWYETHQKKNNAGRDDSI